MAALTVPDIKRAADALIGHDDLQPLLTLFQAEGQTRAQEDHMQKHLGVWLATAAAAHVRQGTLDLATVTRRFGTALFAMTDTALTVAVENFQHALIAVNPELAEGGVNLDAGRTRPRVSQATFDLISDVLARHPDYDLNQKQALVRGLMAMAPSEKKSAPSLGARLGQAPVSMPASTSPGFRR